MCSFQKVLIDLIKAMSRNTAVTYAILGIFASGCGYGLSYVVNNQVGMRLIYEALTDSRANADQMMFIKSRDLQSQIDALSAHAGVVDDDNKMRDSQFVAMREQFNVLSKTMEEVKADVKKLLNRRQ